MNNSEHALDSILGISAGGSAMSAGGAMVSGAPVRMAVQWMENPKLKETHRQHAPHHFGFILKKYREEARMSLAVLAKQSGLSNQALVFLEKGEREPLLSTAIRLAEVLGVSIGQLAGKNT